MRFRLRLTDRATRAVSYLDPDFCRVATPAEAVLYRSYAAARHAIERWSGFQPLVAGVPIHFADGESFDWRIEHVLGEVRP